jgi:hypothetical protein
LAGLEVGYRGRRKSVPTDRSADERTSTVTPVVVAIAVVVAVVVVLCIVIVARSRQDDEGERFRHVADLTSRWSRENNRPPEAPAKPAKGSRTTESVDSR